MKIAYINNADGSGGGGRWFFFLVRRPGVGSECTRRIRYYDVVVFTSRRGRCRRRRAPKTISLKAKMTREKKK